MFPADLILLSEQLRDRYRQAGLWIATAESCTGGLIAGCLTAVSGSSAVVDRGFVTYTNEAKTEMLGVPAGLIRAHGAVSEEVARAMASGVLDRTRADVALSVTGIAGPTGGTAEKPVGLVYLGAARRGRDPVVERHVFQGDRTRVRLSAVRRALEMAMERAG
jgi:nicotinamide-nucleotide amidase